ncbi:S8 family peptidase [Micromonospora palomenae]|uniref:S8 family peptidase n=1 Tax=Micromonospora palomenae TaxID=1461247 RepID=UPI003F89C2F3
MSGHQQARVQGIRSTQAANLPALRLVSLTRLMALTTGRPETVLGIIDGPVRTDHPELASASIRQLTAPPIPAQTGQGAASDHATAIAGILMAGRDTSHPGICPDATLLVRPIFTAAHRVGAVPPAELASAIVETVNAGARVVNLSLGLVPLATPAADKGLSQALDHAFQRGAIVVAAAGNQATIGSTEITRHHAVIPVVAYDLQGRPLPGSNFAHSTGRRGVGAPGEGVTGLAADGRRAFGGTSAAAAFVTGAVGLLWSLFPTAGPAELLFAVTRSTARRTSVVPPLLNAAAAFELLRTMRQ